jgi:hypothetical protein
MVLCYYTVRRGIGIAKSQCRCCEGVVATAAEMEVDIAVIAPSQAYRCIHVHLQMNETTAGEPFNGFNRQRM